MVKVNHLKAATARYFATPDHTLHIKKGQFLFRQQDIVSDLYLIRQGHVIINKMTPDGRELTLRILGPGDLIGEVFMQEEATHRYLVDAKATEATVLFVYPQGQLRQTLASDAEALVDILQYSQLNNQKDQTKFRDLILHGKKGALYSTLIRLTNSYGIKQADGILIDHLLTNQELANFCATSRESVNRLLSPLKKQQIISERDGKLVIHDLDYLKKVINCENCPIVLCTIN